MKIKDIYLCEVCLMTYRNHSSGKYEYEFTGEKLVYKTKDELYIDLVTDEVYLLGPSQAFEGDFFININKELIPITEILDNKFKSASKKRILRKYNEVKIGGNNEYK